MKNIIASLLVSELLAVCAVNGGDLHGRVVLSGPPPPENRIDLTRFPALAKKYPDGLTTRRYQVSSDGGLQNVLVYARGDFAGKKFEPPQTAATFDHGEGIFEPRVMGVQVGQRVMLRYPREGTLQAYSKLKNGFRYAYTDSHIFNEPEVGIRLACECHLWNFAYLGVFDHPFFAVTDNEGKYSIRNLPAGHYTLDAWHPKSGTVSTEITVTDAEGKIADLVVKPK